MRLTPQWLGVVFVMTLARDGGADGPPVVPGGEIVEVRPTHVARIDSAGRMITPWLELPSQRNGPLSSPCGTLALFDNLEAGTVSGYGGSCPGRIVLGTGYNNPFVTNDYTIAPASCAGGLSQRLQVAWYLGPCPGDADGALERHFVALLNWETFGDCTENYDRTGFIDGLVFGPFRVGGGPVPCNPGGYYLADIDDLCELGLGLTMPLDGSGAYDVVLARDYTDSDGDGTPDTLVLVESGHVMLWGCDGPDKPDNPASQGAHQYDDDNPADGVHDPRPADQGGECYDYRRGLCPDPLGAAVAFFNSDRADPPRTTGGYVHLVGEEVECCEACDLNCDGRVDAADIQPFIDRLFGDADPCCGRRGARRHSGDANGDGRVDAGDIEAFVACLFG